MLEINKIYLGDCINLLKEINENSINCLITDPPYNISRKTNFHTMHDHRGTNMEFGEWDKNADILSFIKQLPKICKIGANIVVFNCWENLGDIAKEMRKNEIEPKRCLVLEKINPAPFNRNRMFVNDVEFALWGVFKNKKWIFNREEKLEKCIIQTTVQHKKLHPTMKSIKVIEKLIKLLTKENDLILDCFSGSGTTCLAAKNLNRNFIGIEKNFEYYQIACNRIKQTN